MKKSSSLLRLMVFACLLPAMPWMLTAQEIKVFGSDDLINRPDTCWIFAPQEALPADSLPVVFMLHGWSGTHRQWNDIIDCQELADQYGALLVCPDGLYDSWYLDAPVEGENQFELFFVEELLPWITNHYPVMKDRMYITGLSMGGHGALYLFARYPDYFRSAGSLSGLLDLRDWMDHYGLKRVLQPVADDPDRILEYSVSGQVDKLGAAGKPIFVACGTSDPFYGINVDFVKACGNQPLKVVFVQMPGKHDYPFWHQAIQDQFRFFFEEGF